LAKVFDCTIGLVGTTRTGLMLAARAFGDGAFCCVLGGVLDERVGDVVRFGTLVFFGVAIVMIGI